MSYTKYKELIDFTPLKVLLTKKGIKRQDLADMVGVGVYVIDNYTGGRALPDTEKLAKICAILQCSVNEVVEFTGYEVKERYKGHWDKYVEPRWNGLTYEPLRRLFKGSYGNDWKKKLTEFYDIIPRPERTEKEAGREKIMREAKLASIQELKDKGEYKGLSCNYKSYGKGLVREYRLSISNDEPIPLPRLYDICKALHCTPDWVMTYN